MAAGHTDLLNQKFPYFLRQPVVIPWCDLFDVICLFDLFKKHIQTPLFFSGNKLFYQLFQKFIFLSKGRDQRYRFLRELFLILLRLLKTLL